MSSRSRSSLHSPTRSPTRSSLHSPTRSDSPPKGDKRTPMQVRIGEIVDDLNITITIGHSVGKHGYGNNYSGGGIYDGSGIKNFKIDNKTIKIYYENGSSLTFSNIFTYLSKDHTIFIGIPDNLQGKVRKALIDYLETGKLSVVNGWVE